MKKLYPLLSVLFLISNINGQGWTQTYGVSNRDYSKSGQQTSDGGYIILGYKSVDDWNNDILLIKTDIYGNEEWIKTFSYGSDEYGYSVQQTSDGGLMWGDGILIEDSNESLMSPQPIVNSNGDALVQWIGQSGPVWAADSKIPSLCRIGIILL